MMTISDETIEKIRSYIDIKSSKQFYLNTKSKEFFKLSTQKWIANEVIAMIMEFDSYPPMFLEDRFIFDAFDIIDELSLEIYRCLTIRNNDFLNTSIEALDEIKKYLLNN